ncbi:hypothetical protein TNCV_2547863 [Trichonephila clavipes]|nr:hypothetical protein TNCV_2547863 [Trichonephila clavipes]
MRGKSAVIPKPQITQNKSKSTLASKPPKLSAYQKKESSSSDSSSESDNEGEESAVIPKNQITQNAKSPSKSNVSCGVTAETPVNKAADSDSSDSSSEDENPVKNTPISNNKSVKRKKASSDSDSDQNISQANGELSKQLQKKRKHVLTSTPNICADLSFNSEHSTNETKRNADESPIASDSTKKRRGSSPFRRVKSENYAIDLRLQQSSQSAKDSKQKRRRNESRTYRESCTIHSKGYA